MTRPGNHTLGSRGAGQVGASVTDEAFDQQPTVANRLRSDIAHLEARYDSGAVSLAIYAVLKKLRQELSELGPGDAEGQ